jgi:hypothetical protein
MNAPLRLDQLNQEGLETEIELHSSLVHVISSYVVVNPFRTGSTQSIPFVGRAAAENCGTGLRLEFSLDYSRFDSLERLQQQSCL